jgi:hypothetical protein
VVVVNRKSRSLTVLDGGPATGAAPTTGGGEPAAADGGASDGAGSDGAGSEGADIAQGSFDVALPAVAAGAGALFLGGAALLVVVLRRRRKVSGADGAEVWALD